jgi:hypothetical protein
MGDGAVLCRIVFICLILRLVSFGPALAKRGKSKQLQRRRSTPLASIFSHYEGNKNHQAEAECE